MKEELMAYGRWPMEGGSENRMILSYQPLAIGS
ncbi:MAG: hypothetical protein K0S58_166 [Nitrospira sp.]|jgi:hypothetical protein|nr:hypothetical protein [Nitrospira sp.]